MSDHSALDTETAIYDIATLTALAQWIEGARHIVDDIHVTREIYPELDAMLRTHDIRSGLAWGEEESAGLHILLRHIRQAVATLGPKCEEAVHV